MENNSKYNLILCELFTDSRHGKTNDSNSDIEYHFIVYNRYNPQTELFPYHPTDYYTTVYFDNDDDNDNINNIYEDVTLLKVNSYYFNRFSNNEKIRNYKNIILNENYIKPEIAECIILNTQETIAILKTFWLRIIQKKWKKVFKHRKYVINQMCKPSNLFIREVRGKWKYSFIPGLKGMLHDLMKK